MIKCFIVLFYTICFQRPLMKRQRRSSRPRTSSPQRKSQSLVRRRSARGNRSISRSRSMSPVRASNSMRLARLSLDSGEQNRAGSPQPVYFLALAAVLKTWSQIRVAVSVLNFHHSSCKQVSFHSEICITGTKSIFIQWSG